MFSYLREERFEKFPNNSHILGDKAYPCIPTLMVPYKDNSRLTHNQRKFNYSLSAARSVIERSFSLLKKRFRRLNYLDVKSIEWACKCNVCLCTTQHMYIAR